MQVARADARHHRRRQLLPRLGAEARCGLGLRDTCQWELSRQWVAGRQCLCMYSVESHS